MVIIHVKGKDVSLHDVLTKDFYKIIWDNLKNWFLKVILGVKGQDGKKYCHPESPSRTACIYFWLALIFMCLGMHFFTSKEKTTEKSPSQSLHQNRECFFMIFDNHDLWHFTSAVGLFFTFMWLLTVEDNNTDTHWQKIHVF